MLFGDRMIPAFIPVNLYGNCMETITLRQMRLFFKPVKGVDMGAYKAEISQKLRVLSWIEKVIPIIFKCFWVLQI
jgi:hypothetical protein